MKEQLPFVLYIEWWKIKAYPSVFYIGFYPEIVHERMTTLEMRQWIHSARHIHRIESAVFCGGKKEGFYDCYGRGLIKNFFDYITQFSSHKSMNWSSIRFIKTLNWSACPLCAANCIRIHSLQYNRLCKNAWRVHWIFMIWNRVKITHEVSKYFLK